MKMRYLIGLVLGMAVGSVLPDRCRELLRDGTTAVARGVAGKAGEAWRAAKRELRRTLDDGDERAR